MAYYNTQYINLKNTNYKIWTSSVGSGEKKILVLSGGPGLSHTYLRSFADHLPQENFTVYFYDQLGTGNSHSELTDTSLWTLERYLNELEQVVEGLGLNQFTICGHSWGGILAIEYALKHPDKLSGLIISNMVASVESYLISYRKFRDYLTPEQLETLEHCEKIGDFDSPIYQSILNEFNKYMCSKPLPKYALKCLGNMNRHIYNMMFGKNEFFPNGNLITWNRWNDLPKIQTPTLIIVGQYDIMSTDDVNYMFFLIPTCYMSIIKNSCHLSMIDADEIYFDDIIDFCV